MATDLFEALIYAPYESYASYDGEISDYLKERDISALVEYNLTAVGSKDGGVLTASENLEMSRLRQTLNDVRGLGSKIATFEPNYWKLDGSYALPVPQNEQPIFEMGYWSNQRSNASGNLSPNIVITREFDTPLTFSNILITFDNAANIYPTAFDIKLYDENGVLQSTETITANAMPHFMSEYGGYNTKKAVFTFKKMNAANRHLRITEFDFGIILTFGKEDIIHIETLVEADPTGKTFLTPHVRIDLANKDKWFSVLNPYSYTPYLQADQRLEIRFGLLLPGEYYEYISMGKFRVITWSASDSIFHVEAEGETRRLYNQIYLDSSMNTLDIRQLANKIVDNPIISLESPPITGYFGNIETRQALAYLAELSCCIVYENRENLVTFIDIIGDKIVTGDTPPVDNTEPIETLSYAEITGAIPTATIGEYYNSIALMEYTQTVEDLETDVTATQIGEFPIYFTDPLYLDADSEMEITAQDGYTVSDINPHTTYLTCVIGRTGAGDYSGEAKNGIKIHLSGKQIKLSEIETIYRAPWCTESEALFPYPVNLPFFIKSAQGYNALRDWFLKRRFTMMRKRMTTGVNWRGNPASEIADCFNVQLEVAPGADELNEFSARKNAMGETVYYDAPYLTLDGSNYAKMYANSIELRYDGGLGGTIKLFGDNPMDGQKPHTPVGVRPYGLYNVEGVGIVPGYVVPEQTTKEYRIIYDLSVDEDIVG